MSTLTPVATATSTGDWFATDALTRKSKEENYSFAVDITGAPTAVSVDIEGNVGGSAAFTLATHAFSAGELTAGVAGFHISGKPVSALRYNITITGGTNPTATVRFI